MVYETVQKILINSYTTLVMANKMTIENVPKIRAFGEKEYQIRSEVEAEIAQRTIDILNKEQKEEVSNDERGHLRRKA